MSSMRTRSAARALVSQPALGLNPALVPGHAARRAVR
jgi:hypothetical protein